MKFSKVLLSTVAALTMMTGAASAITLEAEAKTGLTVATVSGDTFKDTKSRLAPSMAIGLNVGLTDMFTIQPELKYAMKGTKVDNDFTKETAEIDYLEIPLLFKFNVPAVPVISPSVYAGPALAILTGANRVPDEGDKIDVKDNTKGTDFGMALGGAAAVSAGPGKVVLDLRYTLGLTNVPDSDDADAKNRAFDAMIGYRIGF